MKKGFIEGDGRQAVTWIEENQKRSFIQRLTNNDCIVLEKASIFCNTRVASNYCDTCKKIIIDIG